MEQQKNNIKVYYGLKWVEFKPITKEKCHRLKEIATYVLLKMLLLIIHVIAKIKNFTFY